jgi:copper chaperone
MESVTFTVEGMHCDGCVRGVTAALRAVPGVRVEEVRAGSARVTLDPAVASREAAVRSLREAGFAARAEGSA